MGSADLSTLRPLDRDGGSAADALQAHLRQLILEGALEPGAVISQVELARALGVSRTPLREALRMLQEEGLIHAEPNRRARVTTFDPGDLDSVYGCRVMLESLAIILTVNAITDDDLSSLADSLDEMRRSDVSEQREKWQTAHRKFHHLLVAGAGNHFGRTIAAYQDRAERYWLMFMRAESAVHMSRQKEHEAIFEACSQRQAAEAGSLLARHLARTALTLMAQMAPERDPIAVRTALQLVGGAPLHAG